ncbi:MAG: DUF2254 domain-containing protein [Phycisphaeraceae bacterium]
MKLKARLLSGWEVVRTSYWFVPSLLVLGALALSVATTWIDRIMNETGTHGAGWLYTGSAEGARALLSTIAGSMIGIAGVVFSITIVALTLASSQLGPRLLRNFMRDLGHQIVLGTFLATFLYGLMILRQVHGSNANVDGEFIPEISVLVAVLLALASVGVLIFFIHHVATLIQAPNVIASVSRELQSAIDHLYPDRGGFEPSQSPQQDTQQDTRGTRIPEHFESGSRTVCADIDGYIQRIELDQLMTEAVACDLVIRVEHRPGQFVDNGDIIIRAWPTGRVDDATARRLRQCFTIQTQRSLAQDAEFAVDQLVDIAVRALSPGVNDPTTAMQCVDRLGACMSRLGERRFPSPHRLDDQGRLRLIVHRQGIEQYLDAAFNQIRQNSSGSLAVMIRMLEAFERMANHIQTRTGRNCLTEHAQMVYEQATETATAPRDRVKLDQRYMEVRRSLNAATNKQDG